MKKFNYTFLGSGIKKPIEVDLNECKTVSDLKRKIATENNLNDDQIVFQILPEKTQLKDIPQSFLFIIKDFTAKNNPFPKGNDLKIKKNKEKYISNKFCEFEKEGFYYSPSFKKFNITVDPITNKIEIKGKYITLNYGQNNFTFTEKEFVESAYHLIKKVFNDSYSISIQRDGKKLLYTQSLITGRRYRITVTYQIVFQNESLNSNQFLDYLSTVFDAQQRLLIVYNDIFGGILKPENIIIYKNRHEIADSNEYLHNVHKLTEHFIFDIKKKSSRRKRKVTKRIIRPKIEPLEDDDNQQPKSQEKQVTQEQLDLNPGKLKQKDSLRRKKPKQEAENSYNSKHESPEKNEPNYSIFGISNHKFSEKNNPKSTKSDKDKPKSTEKDKLKSTEKDKDKSTESDLNKSKFTDKDKSKSSEIIISESSDQNKSKNQQTDSPKPKRTPKAKFMPAIQIVDYDSKSEDETVVTSLESESRQRKESENSPTNSKAQQTEKLNQTKHDSNLKITFFFDKFPKHIKHISLHIPAEAYIQEVKEIIKNKIEIKEEIEILYKRNNKRYIVRSNRIIDDIKDIIYTEIDGLNRHILYVYPANSKTSIKEKIKSGNDDVRKTMKDAGSESNEKSDENKHCEKEKEQSNENLKNDNESHEKGDENRYYENEKEQQAKGDFKNEGKTKAKEDSDIESNEISDFNKHYKNTKEQQTNKNLKNEEKIKIKEDSDNESHKKSDENEKEQHTKGDFKNEEKTKAKEDSDIESHEISDFNKHYKITKEQQTNKNLKNEEKIKTQEDSDNESHKKSDEKEKEQQPKEDFKNEEKTKAKEDSDIESNEISDFNKHYKNTKEQQTNKNLKNEEKIKIKEDADNESHKKNDEKEKEQQAKEDFKNEEKTKAKEDSDIESHEISDFNKHYKNTKEQQTNKNLKNEEKIKTQEDSDNESHKKSDEKEKEQQPKEDFQNEETKSKRKNKRIKLSAFKPTINRNISSLRESQSNFEYIFIYENKVHKLMLPNESVLQKNQATIKKLFDIDDDATLTFSIFSEKEKERTIEDLDVKMDTLKKYKIKISIQPKIEEEEEEKEGDSVPKTIKYLYQTNKSNEPKEICLSEDATVKTLKREIANDNGANNLSNIKILFAGKELLDKIILDQLEIGESKLFVYIRSDEEIFLMTAKALQFGQESSEYEYEYEYEEEEEDDYSVDF
ncbi:hypothetical protein M9Y10_014101 [Tritrichomonas musculus]|uniref:Ubiquitin-like domain-containing protein n=1 Tax=Tritrichomonas musculus TaxID=1915356 RepID=A0ABR2KZR4_9EUKA